MAIGSFNKLFQRFGARPKDAQAFYERGAAALRAGEIDDARTALVEAVNLAPEHLARALSAAEMLTTVHCTDEAAQIFRHVGREARRGLELDPRSVELRLLLAVVCEREGTLAEAAEHLAMALSVDVDHPVANRRLGTILGQLGDAHGSIRCWRRVLAQTGRDDLEAIAFLGMALSTDGQHDEAIVLLADVAQRRAHSSAAQADLGMALLAAKRLEEALAVLGRARDRDPGSAQAHCGLGLVYQQLGRWWEAADAFRRAEQLAPDSPAAPTNLGAVLHILGEHDQARAALARAASLAPDDEEIRRALAEVPQRGAAQDEVTRPMPPPTELSASMAGNLNTFPLLEVLEFLHTQHKNGVLTVSGSHGAGLLRLISGRVVSASTPGGKGLGEALVEQNLIGRKDLEQALAADHDDRDDTLGTLLVRNGSIGQAQLGAVVWREILRALEEMLGWREGAFSFRDTLPEEPPPLSFTLPQIKLSLTKRRDARVGSQALFSK